MKRLALSLAAAIAGCSPGTAAMDNATGTAERLAWRDAPGGGRVAQVEFHDPDVGYSSEDAVRCWPSAAKQDCLAVSRSSVTGYTARRFTAAEAPATKADLDAISTGAGYSCGYNRDHGLTTEAIAGPRGRLVEHSWLSFAPKQPWTARYVANFMQDNAVVGTRWFRCVDLLRRLRDGSIDVVGTSAVTGTNI